jgi:hypothetical protein
MAPAAGQRLACAPDDGTVSPVAIFCNTVRIDLGESRHVPIAMAENAVRAGAGAS